MKSVPVQATGTLENGGFESVLFEPAAALAGVAEIAIALSKRFHTGIIPRPLGLWKGIFLGRRMTSSTIGRTGWLTMRATRRRGHSVFAADICEREPLQNAES